MSLQKPIQYKTIRTDRKTADVVIERDGSVVVRVPEWTDDQHVDKLVNQKRGWILRELASWRDRNASRVTREFVNGEAFLYLGRAYRLILVEKQSKPLVLKDGRFRLRSDLVRPGNVSEATNAFTRFYTEKGRERVRNRAAYYAPKIGVEPASVDVKDLGYRWATCGAKGQLAFHWKCTMAPLTVIDYIVVHELCHLRVRDHSRRFWNEVDKVLPNSQQKRQWLREHGASLDL